jgi:uncharacterized protein (DUF1499 family)
VDGRLTACPAKPNCVNSEFSDDGEHRIAPLVVPPGTEAMSWLREAVNAAGGTVVSEAENYLAATFTSRLFGFVDDVEFRIEPEAGLVQVRSASRAGYGDLGANRARVEAIRALFEE